MVKTTVIGLISIIGSTIAQLLGGWDMALKILITFMAIDYLTGLVVAGVFKKSKKSQSGALESKAGWKGLCRKGVTLLVVLVAAQLDQLVGSAFLRDAVIIAYIVNETISITENVGLMGVYVPAPIMKAIDMLKQKSESEGDNHE